MLAREVLSTGMLHRGDQEEADGLTAGDLMTHPAVTVSPEDSVEVAARLMYTLQVKRLPVIDPSGRLAGIISRADVLAVFDRSVLASVLDLPEPVDLAVIAVPATAVLEAAE
jgi:CBS-domain-containing membrane protein